MSASVFAIVLLGAVLHALWNAIVKGGSDKLLTTTLVSGSAALIAGAILPFLPAPARASWPFIVASTILQIGYYLLLARTYHGADMSQAYPLMRGTAPLIVAVASAAFLKEPLVPLAWLGIAVICGGILGMTISRRPTQGRAMPLALLNAFVIASYTLVDGAGVRRSDSPAAYTLWIFLLTGIPLLLWTFATRRDALNRYVADNWRLGILGGFGTSASYGLALWAMTTAPVAMIAALRETSILFGMLISVFILKEKPGLARIAGACLIAVGAIVLRHS